MSAKEHYRAASIVLPDLPPEIWLSIFRLATWSTDMFSPQLMVSMGCDTSYREQLREFKRSLVTKRYLVRVCKAWYYLASPFLFEYIFLGRGRVLASLRDGMLRSEHAVESQESESPYTIGWRIQRIDVHMRDRTDNPGLIMDILADILRRLPNLRVLTFAITGHGYNGSYSYESYRLPESVLQATNACRDTLRLVNWYGGLRPSSNSWASFLENHPRLEAINAPVIPTQLGNSHIVLDSLKSIYVHCRTNPDQDMLWNINLPSIHHAIYDVVLTPPDFPDDDFLRKIGPKLTSIQFSILRQNTCIMLDIALSRMLDTCKNLARVDLITFKWSMPLLLSSIPTTVHTLGIRVNAHQISRRSLEAFFFAIDSVLSRFPSVKTFYFTDERNVRALRAHPQALSSNFARVLFRGVNVMDYEGRPLVV